MAYTALDFTDVESGHLPYAPVMKMADAGIIKGSSSTTFSPEVKFSPAMWLTLFGRAVCESGDHHGG